MVVVNIILGDLSCKKCIHSGEHILKGNQNINKGNCKDMRTCLANIDWNNLLNKKTTLCWITNYLTPFALVSCRAWVSRGI